MAYKHNTKHPNLCETHNNEVFETYTHTNKVWSQHISLLMNASYTHILAKQKFQIFFLNFIFSWFLMGFVTF